jgi:hypothetical protein
MQTTDWSHLPNAKHIDWVLSSIVTYPALWRESWLSVKGSQPDAVWSDAWCAAHGIVDDAGAIKILDEVIDQVRGITSNSQTMWAIKDVLLALIAYDDCAYMIESDIGELKLIAAFGDPRAILLLPACVVFNEIKLLTNASTVL